MDARLVAELRDEQPRPIRDEVHLPVQKTLEDRAGGAAGGRNAEEAISGGDDHLPVRSPHARSHGERGHEPIGGAGAAPLTGLDAYVRAAMKDWQVPGLAPAGVRGDSVIYVRGCGLFGPTGRWRGVEGP